MPKKHEFEDVLDIDNASPPCATLIALINLNPFRLPLSVCMLIETITKTVIMYVARNKLI